MIEQRLRHKYRKSVPAVMGFLFGSLGALVPVSFIINNLSSISEDFFYG